MGNVVIIDDDSETRLLLKEWCENAGHKAEAAPDGETGIEMCRSLPAELAVVDLVMPKVNGFRVMEQLRRIPRRVKIIAISGAGNHYLPLARVLGADRALPKPFERDEFLTAVKEVLAQAS